MNEETKITNWHDFRTLVHGAVTPCDWAENREKLEEVPIEMYNEYVRLVKRGQSIQYALRALRMLVDMSNEGMYRVNELIDLRDKMNSIFVGEFRQ